MTTLIIIIIMTIIMTMTFLNVKLLKIKLCIAIFPLVVHAEKK